MGERGRVWLTRIQLDAFMFHDPYYVKQEC